MTVQLSAVRGWRRIALWLVVPFLASVAAVGVASPSQAAISCDYGLVAAWGPIGDSPAGFHASMNIRNSGTQPTTGWFLVLGYQAGVTVTVVINMMRASATNPYIYRNSLINAVLQPGEVTRVQVVATKTSAGLSNFPQALTCLV